MFMLLRFSSSLFFVMLSSLTDEECLSFFEFSGSEPFEFRLFVFEDDYGSAL